MFIARNLSVLTNKCFDVKLSAMERLYKKIIVVLLFIPFLSVITFCCCLGKDADAAVENASIEHQELEKADHHSEHQHQNSKDQDECSCPKHLSFLSQQPFDITPDLSSSQLLAKNYSAVPSFEIIFIYSSLLHSQGPPGQDHHDQVSIPIFLRDSNLRI